MTLCNPIGFITIIVDEYSLLAVTMLLFSYPVTSNDASKTSLFNVKLVADPVMLVVIVSCDFCTSML